MVAISVYRGKLHKVPDVPRKWLIPTPSISPKDFKILLRRRSQALARLHSQSTSNPNQQQEDNNNNSEQPQIQNKDDSTQPILQLDPPPTPPNLDAAKNDSKPLLEVINSDLGDKLGDSGPEITHIALNHVSTSQMDSKEERKKEIEEKLKVLNAKKHDLVQVLKQILNAEEELKKRSSTQGLTARPSVSLHVDVTNDSGSMTRHLTPRMGSDGFLRGDGEGGEADDASNHNTHSRNLLRMSSVSPSSDSPHKRPFHSAVPLASRPSPWASASPSRFAPTGQQGSFASAPTAPTVSASGTNYIASSPSPAASGGTSVFRDARHKSPWN
ncbi:tRNA (Ile)-lysidine synthase [Heracleum sosnowskyi]|uniref:tRNA (Ile)-lysidine synthase n=1 Tax=Heracleum sosnowskyi TaxID=360622 RepID=A0AAD8M3S3_9APIA|nr:tRNA (Ile)-lysidine synthase [Heracleum sosnowskyi]